MARYASFILAILFWSTVYSQTNSCPPNIDFELGNLNYWNFYVGSCCPISTPTSTSPISYRDVLTSGTGTDPYGGFPVVAPNGGSYSLRLGDDSTGAQADKARYYIHVPSGVSNYDLVYKYAVVLQNPGHAASQQPRFEVAVYDSATNAQMSCNTFSYVSSGSLPGFTLSSLGQSVYYKPWTTGVINLSGYGGHTVIIDFSRGDCALGGHFGYGYVDMTCGLFQVSTIQCNLSGYTTLTAPPGFQTYTWKDSSLSTTIATGQTVSIQTPSVSTLYKVILMPYSGYGCPDTLSTRVVISNLAIQSSHDTAICHNTSAHLLAGASGGIAPLSYIWTPVNGLSCDTCSNTMASPGANTMYHVTVVDSSGCSRTDSLDVTYKPAPALSSSLTPPSICNNTLFNYTPGSTIANTSFSWSRASVAGISNIAANGTGSVSESLVNTAFVPVNVVYVYALSAGSCPDTQNVVVTVNPKPLLSSNLNNSVCSGKTFSYTPTSSTPGVSFSWSRQVVTGISNAAGSGIDSVNETLMNTTSSTVNVSYMYVLIANGCPDTQSVSVAVKPQPVLSSTLSPSAICNNSLFSYTPASATTGVSFSWSRLPTPGISNSGVSDTGAISESLTSTSYAPVNVPYIYTLSANGCLDTQIVILAVKPRPVLNGSLSPSSVCSNIQFNYSPTSATSGTVFNWSRAAVTGISNAAASDTGSVNEVLLNTTSNLINVNYLFTLNAGGCLDTQTVSVTVKPKPALSSALNPASVCTGRPFTYTPASTVTSTVFAWSRPAVAGIYNPASYGSGGINEALVNTTNGPVNVIYAYFMQASGCVDTQNIVVSIKTYPIGDSAYCNYPICLQDTISFGVLSASAGVVYGWQGPNGFSSSLQNPQVSNAQLSNTGTYRAFISLSGCVDTLSLPVVVHALSGPPVISIAVLPSDTVCAATMLNFAASTSNASGQTFQWSSNGNNIPGANNPAFSTSSLSSGDIITCMVTSNSICQPVNTSTSNPIIPDIISLSPPVISISSYPVHYKTGDTVTFTGHVPQGSTGLTFKWKKNGVFINGNATSVFTSYGININDSVCFVVYSDVPCTIPDSSLACMEMNISTGIAGLSSYEKLNVWPNPVSKELNIEGAPRGTFIKIYNASGQQVYTGVVNNDDERVNTSRFIKGVYLLELNGPEGEKAIRKFVKD